MHGTVTPPERAADTVAARFTGVSKYFGATRALHEITLDIARGGIHALVGENGAGKSTALGILAGRVAPTHGRVDVFGEMLKCGDPRASRRAGVVAIYQELTIVPQLDADGNVFLGQPLARSGFLNNRRMRTRYLELCGEMGITPQPARVPAARMSVADQQLLEILRALVSDAELILLDEPSASLGEREREALLRLMRGLRESGMTIVFVSHNLDEVLGIADTITVFRDGELKESAPRETWTKPRLVQCMMGSSGDTRVSAEMVDANAAPRGQSSRTPGQLLLQAEAVTVPGAVEAIELEVREGEILGVGGLVGAGRTTLLRALAGLEPRSTGRMWVAGKEVHWPRTARRARELGIALLPEDRKGQGLVLSLAAMENVVMSDLRSLSRYGLLWPRDVEAAAARVAPEFGFDAQRLRAPAGQLSGGNQQKLLLARWKHWRPAVLLADEPTRGIDVGAKEEIMIALEAMAADRLGIVIVSSELEEVVAISDRVLVLSEGRPAGELHRSKGEVTVSAILHAAFRVEVGA